MGYYDGKGKGRSHQPSKMPLGHQIARNIRRDILFGRVAPGEVLTQEQLCDHFGTSRMPVRDALKRLEFEGLLTASTSGRLEVSRLNAADLIDSFYVEAVLHSRCTLLASMRASHEEMEALSTLHARMCQAAVEENTAGMNEANWEFHYRINQMARSPRLVAHLRAMSLDIHRDFHAELPNWMSHSNNEHFAILNAMQQRNAELSASLMHNHVVGAGYKVVEFLAQHNPGLGSSDFSDHGWATERIPLASSEAEEAKSALSGSTLNPPKNHQ